MSKAMTYSPEVRERAARMVLEQLAGLMPNFALPSFDSVPARSAAELVIEPHAPGPRAPAHGDRSSPTPLGLTEHTPRELIPMNTTSARLERFVHAQKRDYEQALAELSAGRKRTHWIWYVLPQLRELGRSQLAREYGITGRSEAESYIAHPLLGPRLVECVRTILVHSDRSAVEILGDTDAMKFRSCLTLFAEVAPSEPAFSKALAVFYQSKPDDETLRLLRSTAT